MKTRLFPTARTAGRMLSHLRLDKALLALQELIFSGRFVRAIFYHDTPTADIPNLEDHFSLYRDHFSPVSPKDLEVFLQDGTWHKEKPGLIISFDDGLRTNFDIARPLLERYGFVGWFFVPTGFIEASERESMDWATAHSVVPRQSYSDGRVGMSWDELREMDRSGHVIGSHTHSHHRMVVSTSAHQIDEEISLSKRLLEDAFQHEVTCFSWVGGEEWTYNAAALERIRSAGFRYCFTTLLGPILADDNPLNLHRTGIEARAPLDVVRLQLSGIMDLMLTPTRRRVTNALNVKKAMPR